TFSVQSPRRIRLSGVALATSRSEISAGNKFRTTLWGRKWLYRRVFNRVVDQEDVRTRKRGDVTVRSVHAVGIENHRIPRFTFEHVDAVGIGEIRQHLFARCASTLHHKGLLVVVDWGSARHRDIFLM